MNSSRVRRLSCESLALSFLFIVYAATFAGCRELHNHERIGYVPREIMSHPISLRSGIGVFHDPITTTSRKAQEFYDQGQSYLHSFMWIEAARSFHQALRADPKVAMAYVGLSYAYSPIDYAAASDALDHAHALAAQISGPEKRRIEIRRLQLEAMVEPQNPQKLDTIRHAIDAALQEKPDELELLLLRGNAEEPTPFADGQSCVPSAIPYYDRALQSDPGNFAAEHYLAHCYENASRKTEAIEHAQNYVREAPAVAHAHHMLGHELRRNGQVKEAIGEFLKADALEMAASKSENIPAYLNWHHAHNLGLLADCYQELGQIKAAETALRKQIALPVFTDYAMLGRTNWALFLLNRKRHSEAIKAAEELTRLPSPLAQAAGNALAGQAELALKRPQAAKERLRAANALSQGMKAQDSGAVRTFVVALEAEILLQEGKIEEANRDFLELTRRVLATNNPDAWGAGLYQLQAISAFARSSGNWEFAEQAAKAMLERDPSYAGAHFELALIADHASDQLTARREFGIVCELWRDADNNLPELLISKKNVRAPFPRASHPSSNSGSHVH